MQSERMSTLPGISCKQIVGWHENQPMRIRGNDRPLASVRSQDGRRGRLYVCPVEPPANTPGGIRRHAACSFVRSTAAGQCRT
jgi:hypothetical protein